MFDKNFESSWRLGRKELVVRDKDDHHQVAYEMRAKVAKHVEENDSMMITPTKVDASNLVQRNSTNPSFRKALNCSTRNRKKASRI